ncbi:MAG: FAD-binding oxidoreductase [Chloroflexi bacterium]|nr:FAD-binding oxidoreductase [Chloroflexota bacterium]
MFGAELGERVYRAGIENFFEFERFIEVEDLATDYRRTGLIVLAWSRRHLEGLREEAAELATGGLHGRVVSGSELLDEIGTNHYPGGLVVEEAGAIHPGRYFAALAGAVSEAGADLHAETPALAIERGGGGFSVRTPRGSIACRDVLLATNGYTDRLLPWLRRRVIPVGSYIIATEPLDEQTAAAISPRGRVFFDSKNFLYYWRLGPDRRLLFGGRASFTPTSVDRTAAILRQAMHRVHPQTRRLRIEYAWGGNVGFTFDRLPHIGRHEGISYALGYCGSGVAMATSFGMYMARRLGERSEVAAERSPFEEIPHPGVPLVPAVYRERPWFLPPAGELFRAVDWWSRRDLPTR